MQYLMYVAYTVYVVAAVLMIGAILLQEGKGGGLSALGGTQAESAFGASNPIRRMTVVLAIVFFLLAGFLSFVSSRRGVSPGVDVPAVEKETEAAAGSDATEGDGAAASGEADEGDKGDGGDEGGDAGEDAEPAEAAPEKDSSDAVASPEGGSEPAPAAGTSPDAGE